MRKSDKKTYSFFYKNKRESGTRHKLQKQQINECENKTEHETNLSDLTIDQTAQLTPTSTN